MKVHLKGEVYDSPEKLAHHLFQNAIKKIETAEATKKRWLARKKSGEVKQRTN
jgi:hypothetical protein